jgi:hypothetical protein
LWYLERLGTHHQLIGGRYIEPIAATLDMPSQSLFYVALGFWTTRNASKALGGAV